MPRDPNAVLDRNRAYFDREAADFDAMEKDPSKARDPFRRFVNTYFFRLHEKNRRLDATLAIAKRWRSDWTGLRVLELGGGHARYSIAFAAMGARVTMVDVSAPMLQIARRNVAAAGFDGSIALVHSDLRTYTSEEPFDLVFLTGVTDYLPLSTVEELGGRLSRLGRGLAIVSFPKRYSPINWIRWIWLTIFKSVTVTFFTARTIRRFAERHHLTIRELVSIPGYYVVALEIPPWPKP